MSNTIKKSLKYGAIAGLIFSIIIIISAFVDYPKGYGTLWGWISSIIIAFFLPLIPSFVIGLIIKKETRARGISTLVGGIIGIIIGQILLLFICGHEGCYRGIADFFVTFGASVFLNDFAKGAWILSWYFIVGASMLGFITKGLKRTKTAP